MSTLSLSDLGNLQIKTSPKGVYVFFSFSLILLIFKMLGLVLLDFTDIENISNTIMQYLILISTSSIIGAFFYYVKIENSLLNWLFVSINSELYPDFKRVNLKDCFNDIYISKERVNFISMLLFNLSLFLIFLTLSWQNDNSWMIFSTLAILIIPVICIFLYLLFNKKKWENYIKKHLFMICIIFLTLSLLPIFYNNVFNLIILIVFYGGIVILMFKLKFDWYNFENKIKLIYFKNIFEYYSEMYSTTPLNVNLVSFVKNVKDKYWSGAKISYSNLIDTYLNELKSIFENGIETLSRIFIEFKDYTHIENLHNLKDFFEELLFKKKGILDDFGEYNSNTATDSLKFLDRFISIINSIVNTINSILNGKDIGLIYFIDEEKEKSRYEELKTKNQNFEFFFTHLQNLRIRYYDELRKKLYIYSGIVNTSDILRIRSEICDTINRIINDLKLDGVYNHAFVYLFNNKIENSNEYFTSKDLQDIYNKMKKKLKNLQEGIESSLSFKDFFI